MAVRGRTGIFPHRIDQTTDANAGVDYAHKEVHTGDSFYVTSVEELDTNGINSYRFKTPATTEWMHIIWAIEAQSQITIQIYEGITDAIDPGTIFNRNRNYGDALTAMQYELQNGAGTLGTLIYTWISGRNAVTPVRAAISALHRTSGELVLKTNTTYEWRVTSTGDNNTVSAYFTWYEHTNIEN
jgi:hypothetical protein